MRGNRNVKWATRGLTFLVSFFALAMTESTGLGVFDSQAEVGKVDHPGSTEVNAAKDEYRVTGGGANIWGKRDAFHFVWRKLTGDAVLAADISFVGRGGDAHRKGCLMIRQTLDPDSPYADVAVHGDGLISLQFRRTPGAITEEVKSTVNAPARVRIERRGDRFSLRVIREGKPDESVGPVEVSLHDPVYAGLAVSSHDTAVSETAVFSRVEMKPAGAAGRD